MPAQTGSGCCKVQGYDMPDGHTPVRGVERGDGTTVPEEEVNIPQKDKKKDPLPRLWSISYHEIDEDTHIVY